MGLDSPVRPPPLMTSITGFRSRTLMSFLTRRQRERITSMFGIMVFIPKWTWQANSSRIRISEIAGRLDIGRRSHPGKGEARTFMKSGSPPLNAFHGENTFDKDGAPAARSRPFDRRRAIERWTRGQITQSGRDHSPAKTAA